MKLAYAGVLALWVAGCGGQSHGTTVARPLDEDPIGLLPSGADLIADLDVVQLRQWPPARRFLELLPPAARERLDRLGFDPLGDLDQLVVAVAQLASKQSSSTVVLKGDLELDKLRNALGPVSEVADATYRDVSIAEGPDGALAKVMPRIFVLGSRADVRRVIDLSRGDGESVRASASDRALLAAFQRAPTAKSGRPAIMLATVLTDPLREELKRADLPGAELEWLAVSLAVGDGFDVGAVAGLKGPAEAESLVNAAHARVSEFSSRMAVKLLGLKPYLDPLVMKSRDSEAHLAYRLAAPTVARLLDKLESVNAARPTLAQPAAPQPKSELDR
jgi:hypothetical protein